MLVMPAVPQTPQELRELDRLCCGDLFKRAAPRGQSGSYAPASAGGRAGNARIAGLKVDVVGWEEALALLESLGQIEDEFVREGVHERVTGPFCVCLL